MFSLYFGVYLFSKFGLFSFGLIVWLFALFAMFYFLLWYVCFGCWLCCLLLCLWFSGRLLAAFACVYLVLVVALLLIGLVVTTLFAFFMVMFVVC